MAEAEKKIWPLDWDSEEARRYRIYHACRGSIDNQTKAMVYYRTRPVEWIEDFCYTFDPRLARRNKIIPFMLFPKQREFVQYLYALWQDRESGLVEKCRDIGATWLCCCFALWLWIFHPGNIVGFGSWKEEYVDDKDNPKAIFPKVRQLIKYLPLWMLPYGFDFKKHMTYMKIINPENNSAMIGEAGDNIGRGGRTTMYFKDESAHYERPEKIEAALGDNTDVQVDISSVNGSANVFYRRRMAGAIWDAKSPPEKGRIRVFIFDWRDHPGKTQEWYDTRRDRAELEGLLHIFAQEVDRDYSGAIVGIIIKPEWARAAIDADKKLAALLFPKPEKETKEQEADREKKKAEYIKRWLSGEARAGQDIADGGRDRNAAAGIKGVRLGYLKHWGGEAGDAARIAIPLAAEHGMTYIYYDSIGVGAGFKVESNRMKEESSFPKNLQIMKWDASASPLDGTEPVIPGDSQSPTNEDQYLNLKAQSWFRTRARFIKTYRAVTKGAKYPISEMICLPADVDHVHELVMELSQPVSKTSANGKTMVDKKPEGASSPNLADAFIMADNPTREVSILDVI